ncbi:MAG TPA: hypothetical protein GX527_10605 [Clostridiaceae bacterium]|nr:hypothetical protein [Clostridiaceae bacterium]
MLVTRTINQQALRFTQKVRIAPCSVSLSAAFVRRLDDGQRSADGAYQRLGWS